MSEKRERITLNILRKVFEVKDFKLEIWSNKEWENVLIVKTKDRTLQVEIRYYKNWISVFNEIGLAKNYREKITMIFTSEHFRCKGGAKQFCIKESWYVNLFDISKDNNDPKIIFAKGEKRTGGLVARMPLPIDFSLENKK